MPNPSISDSEAIKNHFREPYRKNGMIYFSGFSGALIEAREASHRREDGTKIPNIKHGSWLGAIGYFSLLEQIGNCFRPQKTKVRVHSHENGIKKALKYFSSLNQDEIDAIYALRCAFAHDYSLSNIKTLNEKIAHHFKVTEGTATPLIQFPKEAWDGNYENLKAETTTTINLERFEDLVEDIIQHLIEMLKNDQLEIALKGGADELVNRYSFVLVQF
jgi:hypothetical protein